MSNTRVLTAVLPGLPQLLAGRWGSGATALLTWLGLLFVVATRADRVMAAPSGPWDARVALVTVVGGLVASWSWSWRDVAGREHTREVGVSQMDLAIRAFSKNRTAVAGLILIVGLYVVALITPLIAPHDPMLQNDLETLRLVGLSADHLMGTDQYARDVLSRVLYGARISLTIGFIAVGISVTIGTLLGSIAGYFGGIVDGIIMRFVDTMIAFPRLILLITIIAIFESSTSKPNAE